MSSFGALWIAGSEPRALLFLVSSCLTQIPFDDILIRNCRRSRSRLPRRARLHRHRRFTRSERSASASSGSLDPKPIENALKVSLALCRPLSNSYLLTGIPISHRVLEPILYHLFDPNAIQSDTGTQGERTSFSRSFDPFMLSCMLERLITLFTRVSARRFTRSLRSSAMSSVSQRLRCRSEKGELLRYTSCT
jgi:hypothetical protein